MDLNADANPALMTVDVTNLTNLNDDTEAAKRVSNIHPLNCLIKQQ